MKPEPGELRLMVDDMKDMARGMGKDLAKKIGTIKEPVPTDVQYQAWIELTPQERGQKVAEMGLVKGQQWYAAMAKMGERRQNNAS